MKLLYVFLLFLPAACASAPAHPRAGHGGNLVNVAYARSLTEAAREDIASCASNEPDARVCKRPDFWLFPLRAVKFALLKAGVVSSYLVGGNAEILGNELAREGFVRLHPADEEHVPPGAVVIYSGASGDTGEIKGDDGFYYGNRARKGSAFDKELPQYARAGDEGLGGGITESRFHADSFAVWVKPTRLPED